MIGKIELSVAVASNLTKGSSYSISLGQLTVGATSSGLIVRSKVHYKFKPLLWVALTVTVVVPWLNEEPDRGIEITVRIGDAEIEKFTTAFPVVILSGHIRTG